MEYIIILLIIILIGLVVALIISMNKSSAMIAQMNDPAKNQSLTDSLMNQNASTMRTQGYVESMTETVAELKTQMTALSHENGANGERLSQTLKTVEDMNRIMVNHKRRGNFGEFQLSNLMSVYCGDNQAVFTMQYTLPNGTIVDCALQIPGDDRILGIDSKFPLESYMSILKISDSQTNDGMDAAVKQMANDVKKHIDDISSKYINANTQPYAVMFVPSEAIYQFIAGSLPDVIEYGHRKKVLMASPTTLLGVVFTIISLTKDYNRAKHVEDIEKSLLLLQDDAERLVSRLQQMDSQYQTLGRTMQSVAISSNKIKKKIDNLSDGQEEG